LATVLELRSPIDQETEDLLRSRGAGVRLADLLAVMWEALVAPFWPEISDCLERDIFRRSRALADGGLTAVFDGMAPLLTLDGHRLFVHHKTTCSRSLRGEGMLFMPSAFIFPRVTMILDEPPTPATLCYRPAASALSGSTTKPLSTRLRTYSEGRVLSS
jgi:hypothetical protein